MDKKKRHMNFETYLMERLKDPKLALAYLNETLNDDDKRVFLIALRDVLLAQGGDVTALAEEAKLNRQNLYRMLSKKGNPRWDSITSLCEAMGFQVQLAYKK
jgi:probable addiction module antidote protein